ncbi:MULTISPECIES: Co2+/Mg2+ efflux protein ApaG [unclassified Chelatococcus]|uniref:Co2+/Mg2+ efflux protein ApaG n=1 Tax=unclassified Chelatococcus TaxID=2638111 RepID=UPI001BCF4D92|nr:MULTISPECIES: Co2+/Mg2+ efflux protein ApaG [unclassified Chelatococcus]MBS7697365.1 Co2+/Mg2+ efflux protein ApaG [Chelatococcus sp. YT9]MBX3556338.1 Co2+/Mg2+ efflux protein ApaG [Chelatococcus sp.]
MYETVTRNIRVGVVPRFLEKESLPAKKRFFWSYTIEITNLGQETVQLMARHWHITDGLGRQHEVRGEGVVGEKPVIEPGETFSYTSGCPLSTPHGTMLGTYQMESQAGESFSVNIPLFPLESPYIKRVMH